MAKKILLIIVCFSFLISGNLYAHGGPVHVDAHDGHTHIHEISIDNSGSDIGSGLEPDKTSGLLHCGSANFLFVATSLPCAPRALPSEHQTGLTPSLNGVVIFQETPPPKIKFLS